MRRRLARVNERIVKEVVYKITDEHGNLHDIRGNEIPALDEAFEKGLYFTYPLGLDIPLYEGGDVS